MSELFTIYRAAEGPGWPFGAGAVAAGSALLGGLVGLATPMAVLDWVAYQSYLDQIAGLNPPLGGMAKLAFVALMAVLLGAIGYGVACWAGVRSTGGFAELLARLRGARDEDEDDAPRLRGSDRHPDAPARRPLSATRDLNADRASAVRRPLVAHTLDDLNDDEDELLLISPMPAAVPVSPPAPVETMPASPQMPVLPLTDHVSESGDTPDADWSDADDGFDITAPHADDWLVASASAPVADEAMTVPVAVMASPGLTPEFARVARTATPPPLDLSAARLDELIARVEAGIKRREAAPVAAMVAEVEMPAPAAPDAAVSSYTAAPVIADPVAEEADPSFPNDPALAAALATLRRMAAS